MSAKGEKVAIDKVMKLTEDGKVEGTNLTPRQFVIQEMARVYLGIVIDDPEQLDEMADLIESRGGVIKVDPVSNEANQ